MSITDTWLKANHKKLRTKKLIKTDRDGLNARISPKGKITFMMRYYYNNIRQEFDIGTYPLMYLKEARVENLRLRKELERGHNPKVFRRLEKQTIIACFLEEHGEVAGDVLAHFGDNIEDAKKALNENYNGCYTSLADYAEELTTETSEVPEHLAFYIDYDRMARDMEMSGDIFTVETGFEEIHVFWAH